MGVGIVGFRRQNAAPSRAALLRATSAIVSHPTAPSWHWLRPRRADGVDAVIVGRALVQIVQRHSHTLRRGRAHTEADLAILVYAFAVIAPPAQDRAVEELKFPPVGLPPNGFALGELQGRPGEKPNLSGTHSPGTQ